jgi:hypothetical protein
MHRFKAVLVFLIVDYGGMSISTAMGASETESDVTSR